MKAILRSAGLAVLYLAVLGCVSTVAFAQGACEDADGIAALDATIRNNFEKIETLETAVESAKAYMQKFGECEAQKPFVEWLKQSMPKWESRIWTWVRVNKFDNGLKNKKYDDVYAAGTELVQRYPENVHYLVPMGLIGLYETYAKNFKYNDESIKYAKLALAKLKSGKAEPKKDKEGKPILDADGKAVFGAHQFERNAEDAISELTYALAYVLYHAKNDRKAGLLYYYEVSLTPGPFKNEPRLYATIGQYYKDESVPIGKTIADLITKLETATSDEEKAKLDLEIRAKIALRNGYLERALDAFSRAHKFSNDKVASEKVLKEQMFKLLQATYALRESRTPLDTWISNAGAKPFPDPASEVTPIFDPEPAKATPADPARSLPAARPGRPKSKADTRKPTD